MAEENDPTAETTATAAARPDPTSLRQRMGKARFNRQVRDEYTAELKKLSKKKTAGFTASDVDVMVEKLTDTDIDRAVAQVQGGSAESVDAAQPDGAQAEGIKDWWADHGKELVLAVVQLLLKQFLGA